VIGIGDTQIDYIAGRERKDGPRDMDETDEFQQDDAAAPTAKDFSGEIRLVDFHPEKTTVDPARRARKYRSTRPVHSARESGTRT